MDDDRELLEKAAKAAGMKWIGWDKQWTWNPLTDDGDALRLAVKLNITVKVYGANIMCDDMNGRFLADHVDAEDPYAATRRAIVRAAAALSGAGTRTASDE